MANIFKRQGPDANKPKDDPLRTSWSNTRPTGRMGDAAERVATDNAPSWREPPLPGLGPTPVEKEIQRGWTAYHAETDRIAAERLPKEQLAPVTYQEGLAREGQADARAHARELHHEAEYASLEGREDFVDTLLAEARAVLKREGLDEQGRPNDQERLAEREREYRERGERTR